MILSPLVKQRFFDSTGLPLAGGQLFTYIAGTSTPQATYSNQAGTTNANPVVLDANGYADVWIDSTKSYKFVLEDSSNNVIWTVDNINGIPVNGGLQTVNTLPQNTTITSGNTLLWPNLTIPTGLTLTVNSGACFSGIHPITVASGGAFTINSGGSAYII